MSTLSANWLMPAEDELPPDRRTVLLACGTLFDAVRIPDILGMPVLERLLSDEVDADQLGPVLWDQRGGLLYWLVSPGATDDYPDGARLLGPGAWISVPPPYGRASKDAAWLHLPEQRIVTGPAWLSAALNGHSPYEVAA